MEQVSDNDRWPMVNFRAFSPESRAAVLAKATGLGLSVSDYLRGVVARDLDLGGNGDGALSGANERLHWSPASRSQRGNEDIA